MKTKNYLIIFLSILFLSICLIGVSIYLFIYTAVGSYTKTGKLSCDECDKDKGEKCNINSDMSIRFTRNQIEECNKFCKKSTGNVCEQDHLNSSVYICKKYNCSSNRGIWAIVGFFILCLGLRGAYFSVKELKIIKKDMKNEPFLASPILPIINKRRTTQLHQPEG